MIKALINTTFAGRFGASVQRAPSQSDTIRLTASADGIEIVVWDMTEAQAETLYGHLSNKLGHSAGSLLRSYHLEQCVFESPSPRGPIKCGVVRSEHVSRTHEFKSPNAG